LQPEGAPGLGHTGLQKSKEMLNKARKINPTFASELNICSTDRQVLTSSTKSKVFFVIYCRVYFKRLLWYEVSVWDGDYNKLIYVLQRNDGTYGCLNKLKNV